MKYINDHSLEYILGKYHEPGLHPDKIRRFARRDSLFSENTGMDGEEIKKNILTLDGLREDMSHPVRKALAFEYVLKNSRISCDPRDIFPGINMIDRPLDATVVGKWRKEVFEEIIPEVEKKRSYLENAGIVTIWPDYDHSMPIWERVLDLGFSGLLSDSENARKNRSLSADEEAFFDGIKITYEAILTLIERLQKLAEATKGSEKMASALKNIRKNPPATFYEALLVNYLYFIISEHIQGLQVRSSSNFDRLYYNYYKNDLERGVSEEELRCDLAYFFLELTAIGNYWQQPVYLGGCKADESTEINDLSYVFLDVYDKMGIHNPKIQIKIADSTPADFVKKALDMIRRGHNSIVFVSDATIRRALVRSGATEEEARLAKITGCYEYGTQGSFGTGMNYLNLLKPLEYALHEGRDGVTFHQSGPASPHPDRYKSFDEFYNEYKRQLRYIIDETIETVNGFEGYLAYINPQSMLSATFPSCLEKAKDAIGGGSVKNGSNIMFGFLADLADSIAMIKKHVFDKKELTLGKLTSILDKNYDGEELLRKKLLCDRDKFGNNKDLPDGIATDIVEYIRTCISDRKNSDVRGGKWGFGFHVARMSYIQGLKTAASPNGRLYGEELSKNCSASMGQNREGATAAILSTTKIDATSFTSDASLDLGLLPSAVSGEDGLLAMYGLLMTFVKRGGHALHINVFNAEKLKDAQAHPEKYQDLQIRVCGWNALWNNINKTEQDGFIRQAESLI